MKQEKIIKNLRKALFIIGIIEKVLSINKGIKDASEGLEEIEKSLKKNIKKQ